jgi:starch synthase (maltosyl-transferring)
MNSILEGSLSTANFTQTTEYELVCHMIPLGSGIYSFRAEFSLDIGATWLGDTVPDSWILVDPRQTDALRLYTFIPTVSGQIDDWIADLTRIRDMGFNAIHLLPVTALGASESPYAASDLFDIDPSYLVGVGNEDALTQFESYVEKAKSLDIQLCFDLVLNHVAVDSKIARRAPDWIVPDQDQPDGLRRARYWSGQAWENWNDLVLINYEHPSHEIRAEIWAYMTAYALFWAKYADETGGFVRFDNLHSSNPEFISEVTRVLHSQFPEVAIIAEYFTDQSTLLHNGPKWGLNLVLATPWNQKFVPQLRQYLAYIHSVSEHIRYYMPITSHDCGAPSQEFGTANSTVPRYVAAALLGTGATGIPEGVEYGEEERINFIGRKPRTAYPKEARFAQFLSRVNSILAEHQVFRTSGSCEFVDHGHPAILAAYRRDGSRQSLGFLVVCNFDTKSSQRIEIDWASVLQTTDRFTCIDLLSGGTRYCPSPPFELLLPPCSAQVLKIDYEDTTAV